MTPKLRNLAQATLCILALLVLLYLLTRSDELVGRLRHAAGVVFGTMQAPQVDPASLEQRGT